MNEVTPMEQEALITFGYVYMAFCIWIYNLRSTFPEDDILFAFIDISNCFLLTVYPLARVFRFMIGPLVDAENAMEFGSVASVTFFGAIQKSHCHTGSFLLWFQSSEDQAQIILGYGEIGRRA